MYNSTLAELLRMVVAHKRNAMRQFEHTRAISYFIAQTNSSKTLPPVTDWWPLPTDEKTGSKGMVNWVEIGERRRAKLIQLGYLKPISD